MTCTRHHSQYVYNASAFALAAEFERPKRYSLPPHASVVLAGHGGHGTNTHPGLKVDGLVSFQNAYAEVGGSYDDCHNRYTTHAWAVLEGVNVADMLTADRVVSRIAIYHPAEPACVTAGQAQQTPTAAAPSAGQPGPAATPDNEATFDFTGSYFENLRIAGHELKVELATNLLHRYNKYSALVQDHATPDVKGLMLGSGLSILPPGDLAALEDEYHALTGMAKVIEKWQAAPTTGQIYRLSAANGINMQAGGPTEVTNYGSVICIPKFGVIRLAELTVGPHTRSLTMFRVQMCSSGHGGADGTTTTGTSGGH